MHVCIYIYIHVCVYIYIFLIIFCLAWQSSSQSYRLSNKSPNTKHGKLSNSLLVNEVQLTLKTL